MVENIKVPKMVYHWSLKETFHNPFAYLPDPYLTVPDTKFFGMGRYEQLHLALRAIWQFQKENKRLPGESDFAQILAAVKDINEQPKSLGEYCVDEIDEELIHNAAVYSRSCLSPMAAFFGGIVAQEIVKYTGKYTPLKQWLHYDIFETLPRGPADRTTMNCRYDDQILVYGREVQEKLTNINTFMVGAGALGCEYLKAFALMGVGCSAEGKVTVTDN